MNKIKIAGILPVILSIFLLANTSAAMAEFSPCQIIVKLKPQAAEKIRSAKYDVRKSGVKGIEGLNDKYEAKGKIRPVFKKLHSAGKKVLAKEAADLSAAKFARRHKRAPEHARVPDLENIYLIEIDPSKDVSQAVSDYQKDPDVLYAEPNYIMKTQMIPDDPYYISYGSWGQPYDDLWGVKKIQSEEAWDLSQGKDIIVAVIDSGLDYNHPDIWDNVWVNPAVIADENGDGRIDLDDVDANGNGIIDPLELFWPGEIPIDPSGGFISFGPSGNDVIGWNFVDNNGNPMDDNGHGTHCAGTIAATGNNGMGVIGIAPKAKIMVVKGINNAGAGDTATLADCIYYAVNSGADVLSNSWGGGGSSRTLSEAFDYAYSQGCISVVAAGNNNADITTFIPANFLSVMTVSAVDYNDDKASFSNYGLKIDVAAPGVDILSLRAALTSMGDIVGNYYTRASGTSMACPHVAGLAALTLCKYGDIGVDTVRAMIRANADDIYSPGFDVNSGNGRINSYNALKGDTQVMFAKSIYAAKEPIKIVVVDPEKNIKPQAKETVSVRIKSDTEAEPLECVLTEEENDLGIFFGFIMSENGPPQADDKLQVTPGDAINVEYLDESNGHNRILADTAFIKATTVTVLNNDIGVNGALVSIYPSDNINSDYPIWETYTDESGIATMVLAERGYYFAKVSYAGGIIPGGYFYAPADVVVELPRPSKVTVLLSDGTGFGNIEVKAYNSGGGYIAGSMTDSNGVAYLNIANGASGTIKALYEGACIGETAFVSAPMDVMINIPESSVVTVMRGDAPVSGVTVCASDSNGNTIGRTLTTNDEGKAYFYLSAGTVVKFTAISAGFYLTSNFVTAPASVNFSVPPPSTVTLLNNGLPVAGASIQAWKWGVGLLCGGASTDMNGVARFYLEANQDVAFEVCYQSSYFESGRVATPCDIVMNVPSPTMVKVMMEGSPVADAEVEARGSNSYYGGKVYTDASGNAVFYLTHGEQYKFKIYCNSWFETEYVTTPANFTFDVPQGTVVSVLKGAVPIANILVQAFDANTNFLGARVTNSNGIAYFNFNPGMQVKFYIYYNGTPYWSDIITTPGHATINIPKPPNRAPVIGAIYGSHWVNETNTLDLTVAGSDPDGDALTYSAVLVDGRALSDIGATLNLSTGAFSWTPTYDQAGNYTIIFTVSDGELSDDESFNITVYNINRSPVMDPIGEKIIDEGETLSFVVTAADPDNDALHYSAGNLPAGATFNANAQTFNWTPSQRQAGVYSVVFSVSDWNSGSAGQLVKITVNSVNVPPVFNAIENQVVNENERLEFPVSAYDLDGDILTYSASNLPSGAIFDLKPTNYASPVFIWMPTYEQSGVYTVLFSVTDGIGKTVTKLVSITVNNVNRFPMIDPIGNKTVDERQALSFVITATDPDNDPLTYYADGLPSGAVFDSGAHTFRWTPSYEQAGVYTISFSVSDGIGKRVSQLVNITVNNVNRPPIATNHRVYITRAGKSAAVTLTGFDPDGDALKYIITKMPLRGTIKGKAPNFIYYAPGWQKIPQIYYLRYKVNDGKIDSNTAIITFVVIR